MKNVDYDVEAFDDKGFGAFLMDSWLLRWAKRANTSPWLAA